MSELEQISFFALRKTSFRESSLIVTGLTPEKGLVSVMLKGARKQGPKQFPVMDVFRVFDAWVRAGKGEILNCHSVELASDFSRVARSYKAYEVAVWLARFVCSNLVADMACPRTYSALLQAFERLEAASVQNATLTAQGAPIKAAFLAVVLDEEGQLPPGNTPAHLQGRQAMIEAGEGKRGLPALTAKSWGEQLAWLLTMVEYGGFVVPGKS